MVKLLVISDVHSNFQALEAVLKDAEQFGPYDRHLCAGDVVGYGPQPNEVIETLKRRDFFSVMGNHDKEMKIGNSMYGDAKIALKRNREKMKPENHQYVCSLQQHPYVDSNDQFAMVHATFSRDEDRCVQRYVYTTEDVQQAMRGLNELSVQLGIIGHTHLPTTGWGWVDCFAGVSEPQQRLTFVQNGLYFHRRSAWAQQDQPPQHRTFEVEFSELHETLKNDEFASWHKHIIFNPGSVGQPRNGWIHASYGIVTVEDGKYTLTTRQVPYDVEKTQTLMREQKFPKKLIDRLAIGT